MGCLWFGPFQNLACKLLSITKFIPIKCVNFYIWLVSFLRNFMLQYVLMYSFQIVWYSNIADNYLVTYADLNAGTKALRSSKLILENSKGKLSWLLSSTNGVTSLAIKCLKYEWIYFLTCFAVFNWVYLALLLLKTNIYY